jgi:hypothetical protein
MGDSFKFYELKHRVKCYPKRKDIFQTSKNINEKESIKATDSYLRAPTF